jgi:hypothetical protein
MRQRLRRQGPLTTRTVAVVGVALLLVAAIAILWPRPEPAVAIPDVVGMVAGDAAARLIELGLEVETEPVDDADAAPGTVTGQEPVAGTSVPAGARVLLRVATDVPASGEEEVTVPDLFGLPVDVAVQQLTGLGLQAETVGVVSDGAVIGTVVTQVPAADTAVPSGSTVRLEVAEEAAPAANVVAWILGLGPGAPAGPPQFRAYDLVLQNRCPELAVKVATEGDDLARLDAELGGLYAGVAAGCLAAFHGQPDRWADAEAALGAVPQPVSCVDVAAHDLLRRLVEHHRANPAGEFQANHDPGVAQVPPCPTITALEPPQGSPGGIMRILGTNLEKVLEVRVIYDDGVGDSFDRQLEGGALVFTVNEFTDAGEACVYIVAGDQWNAAGQRFTVVPAPGATQSPAAEPIFTIEECPPESAE